MSKQDVAAWKVLQARRAAELTAKIEKLPKWAQEHIQSLERKIEARSELINQISGEHEESPVWQELGSFSEKSTHYLDPKQGVRFRLPKVDEHVQSENILHVGIDRGRLRISSEGYPTQLVVRPHVTNVVYVSTVKDTE